MTKLSWIILLYTTLLFSIYIQGNSYKMNLLENLHHMKNFHKAQLNWKNLQEIYLNFKQS